MLVATQLGYLQREVLRQLREHPNSKPSEIASRLQYKREISPNVFRAVYSLERRGLVRPLDKGYVLTDKGTAIAEKMQ